MGKNLKIYRLSLRLMSLLISLSFLSPAAAYQDLGLRGHNSQVAGSYNEDVVGLLGPKKNYPKQKRFKASGEIWLTLAPDVITHGPILDRSKHVTEEEQEYVRNIFGYLIQKADLLARDDHYNICENQEKVDAEGAPCKEPLNWTYYSFLVAALTVPHHESYLNHLQVKSGPNNCDQVTNDLKRAENSKVRKALDRIYRDEENILAPDCKYFSENDQTTQVFSSQGMYDFGIMQLNGYYHTNALEPFSYLNVYHFIDRGLEYLYHGDQGRGGYNFITHNYNRSSKKPSRNYASCSWVGNPYTYKNKKTGKYVSRKGTRATRFYGMIRGAWDKYNQGGSTLDRVCRFGLKPKNSHVTGFRESLLAVIKKDSSLFHVYLPEGSDERRAFNEIVYNFRSIFTSAKELEKNHYLNKVLKKVYKSKHENNIYTAQRKQLALTHTVSAGSPAKIYSSPVDTPENICGSVEVGGRVNLEFKNIGADGGFLVSKSPSTGEDQIWARVKVPQYSSFLSKYNTNAVVRLAQGKNAANIRKEISGDLIGQFNNTASGVLELPFLGVNEKKKWYKVDFNGQEGWVWYGGGNVVKKELKQNNTDNKCQRDYYYTKLESFRGEDVRVNFDAGDMAVAVVSGYDRGSVANLRRGVSGKDELIKAYTKGAHLKLIAKHVKPSGSVWYKAEPLNGQGEAGWVWGKAVNIIYKYNYVQANGGQ